MNSFLINWYMKQNCDASNMLVDIHFVGGATTIPYMYAGPPHVCGQIPTIGIIKNSSWFRFEKHST